MHILCNTIKVVIISSIFIKGTSGYFTINLHLFFKIPNVFFAHIIIEDYVKFQFVSFPDSDVFPPLNGQYIQGLTEYAASIFNLYG